VITVSTENKKFTAGISAILTMKYPGNPYVFREADMLAIFRASR
jgi:hypothetical protein